MTTVKLNVPPDQTPEEEMALVARVAAAIVESGKGVEQIAFELHHPEEVDYHAVSDRTESTARWA